MSFVQILNAVLIAAGATMGLVLGVVCIIYGFYVSSNPRLLPELETMLVLTAGFWLVSGVSAVAYRAHRHRWRWRWLTQPLPLLPITGIAAYLWATG